MSVEIAFDSLRIGDVIRSAGGFAQRVLRIDYAPNSSERVATVAYVHADGLPGAQSQIFQRANDGAVFTVEKRGTTQDELISLADDLLSVQYRAACSQDNAVAMTRFGSMPHTGYSVLSDALMRLLMLITDGNKRRAMILRNLQIDNGESIRYNFDYAESENWRGETLRRFTRI